MIQYIYFNNFYLSKEHHFASSAQTKQHEARASETKWENDDDNGFSGWQPLAKKHNYVIMTQIKLLKGQNHVTTSRFKHLLKLWAQLNSTNRSFIVMERLSPRATSTQMTFIHNRGLCLTEISESGFSQAADLITSRLMTTESEQMRAFAFIWLQVLFKNSNICLVNITTPTDRTSHNMNTIRIRAFISRGEEGGKSLPLRCRQKLHNGNSIST